VSVTVSTSPIRTSVSVSPIRTVTARSTSGGSGSIGSLTDVDVTTLQDGSILVYNSQSGKFESTTTLENQILNGGNY
jgi:hypothetical protein